MFILGASLAVKSIPVNWVTKQQLETKTALMGHETPIHASQLQHMSADGLRRDNVNHFPMCVYRPNHSSCVIIMHSQKSKHNEPVTTVQKFGISIILVSNTFMNTIFLIKCIEQLKTVKRVTLGNLIQIKNFYWNIFYYLLLLLDQGLFRNFINRWKF